MSTSTGQAAQSPVAIQRVGQISVPVQDLARASIFYRDVLGLRMYLEMPTMAFFDCGGIRLMLAISDDPEFDHRASILYYQVSDLDVMHATLVSHDVRILKSPHLVAETSAFDLWMCFFRDTEDNVLALMSEKPKRAGP